MDVTIVTAFMSNINNNDKNNRTLETYILHGKELLNSNANIVVYLENAIYEENKSFLFDINDESEGIEFKFFEFEGKLFKYFSKGNHTVVLFEKRDMYFYEYSENITKFNVSTSYPPKDTLEYMFVQCHKTEWIKMTIKLNEHVYNNNNDTGIDVLPFNSDKEYIWVDFGINPLINRNGTLLIEEIDKLVNRVNTNKHDKIRIASCSEWDFNILLSNPDGVFTSNIPYWQREIKLDNPVIYHYIQWFFAGSVFGGPSDKLLEFANLTKQTCIDIMTQRNHLMWEVNVWCLVFLNHSELFDPYACGHDPTIITCY